MRAKLLAEGFSDIVLHVSPTFLYRVPFFAVVNGYVLYVFRYGGSAGADVYGTSSSP